MGIFSSKSSSKVSEQPNVCGTIINYVKIDSINGKEMNEYYWAYSDQKKGLLAKKIEIVFLEPGEYEIVAHGRTYQTKPTLVKVTIADNQQYMLGANEEALYCLPC